MSLRPKCRILITGGDGFVAPYAARAILDAIENAQILYSARRAMTPPLGCTFTELDIVDTHAVARAFAEFHPTHILHLAGIASRSAAEENPAEAWNVNVVASLRLASELKSRCPGATFLFASSSQVYDARASGLIAENTPIGPEGVYASTKAATDLALGAMASDSLRVVRLRPFNHTGPGQATNYAFGSFAEQIAAIEVGHRPPILKGGNLAVKRDFLDVRDVASAYAKVIALSDSLPKSNIFNLASGIPRSIEELLDVMLSCAKIRIEKVVDPCLQRNNEIETIAGDYSHARIVLNWAPLIPLETTLKEMVDCERTRLTARQI
jgi:GDP-4-dehydro-6-deoxy-D-mannose reductase